MTTSASETDSPPPTALQRLRRTGLLATVFVCAACGLVYELALITLGSYLVGNTASQAAIVLSVMVFAMGIGALMAKPLQSRPAVSFAVIELLLAFLGGTSVLILYAAFAWLHLYTVALVVVAFLIGLLVGAEIPLLMELLQRIRKQSAGSATADLFAADYIGGLLGGLAFPFLLLPMFGQIRGALLVGAINAIAGLVLVFTVFHADLRKLLKIGLGFAAITVTIVLTFAYVHTERFEAAARQALYAHPIVYSEHTAYQQIVVTESISPFGERDLRLFLNGDLQFSSVDEYRYHEALVHPAMDGPRDHVLVLGGGDGLGVREVLRYEDVESVTVVDLDPAVTALASTFAPLVALNEDSLSDPRVTVINEDAFNWLRDNPQRFDVIIADLPDPDQTSTAKLYSVEFYGLARQLLEPEGRISIQSGSPYFAPDSFWTIHATVVEADFAPKPYWVSVPSFGDWGFLLANLSGEAPELSLDETSLRDPLQSLTAQSLHAAAVFPPDRDFREREPSTLMNPHILQHAQREWRSY
ncbi:polyamine aminopropyltransferase [Natronoglycomyces albus]|uniref:Polyamine aminopropyltransferase n=1 Tax=Natronoglycomyces albus TaxID=2811108 RepID=A0A895XS16_9ACTN|nr:polyamine aminopropyltransferase [Natronoglycomyces albus]QSB06482.1 polyamine aminopropyltransferase [Natronoglycomyces albus]